MILVNAHRCDLYVHTARTSLAPADVETELLSSHRFHTSRTTGFVLPRVFVRVSVVDVRFPVPALFKRPPGRETREGPSKVDKCLQRGQTRCRANASDASIIGGVVSAA